MTQQVVVTVAAILILGIGVYVCRRFAEADWGSGWLNTLDGLNRIFCKRYHRLRADPVGLPEHGAALVVANHVSGLDPLLLIAACKRPLRFVIAQEEYDRWWLRWLFKRLNLIPVRRSRDPQKALYAARRALEQGEVVALFPQGRMHRDDEPLKFKRGVVLLSAITGAPIHPMRLEGIRGQGLTVAAVFVRSRARVRAFAPVHCTNGDTQHKLAELERMLSPPDARPPV
jgi:1-acyl-sn-glycerol-3-phosphate acyltransferase